MRAPRGFGLAASAADPSIARVSQLPPVRRFDPTFPSLGPSILIVIGFIGLQMACLVPLVLYSAVTGDGTQGIITLVMNPWILGTVNVLAATGVLSLALRRTGETPRQFLTVRAVSLRFVAPVVITSLGLGVILDQIDTVLVDICRRFSIAIEDPLPLAVLARFPLGTFLTLVVVAPLTEEYLMRGLVLRGLLRRHGPALAIFISALLFGLMHANLRQFIVGLAVGGAFGWWYQRTASVAPCILGHAVFNAVATLAILVPEGGTLLGHYAPDGTIIYQPWWLTLGGVLAIAGGLSWFKNVADTEPAPEPEIATESEPPLLAAEEALPLPAELPAEAANDVAPADDPGRPQPPA